MGHAARPRVLPQLRFQLFVPGLDGCGLLRLQPFQQLQELHRLERLQLVIGSLAMLPTRTTSGDDGDLRLNLFRPSASFSHEMRIDIRIHHHAMDGQKFLHGCQSSTPL